MDSIPGFHAANGPHDQVVFSAGEVAVVRFQNNVHRRTFHILRLKRQLVAQVNGLHDHSDDMISIIPASEYIKT